MTMDEAMHSRQRQPVILAGLVFLLLFLCSTEALQNRDGLTTSSGSFPEAPRPSYQDMLSSPGAVAQTATNMNSNESYAKVVTDLNEMALAVQRSYLLLAVDHLNLVGASHSSLRREAIVNALLERLEALSASGDASETCVNDTGRLVVGIAEGQTWALKFLDASGKIRPGLSQLRVNFVGDYDLCRGLVAPPGDEGDGFKGNYCTLKAGAGPPSANPAASLNIQWGICMPSTCSETENTMFFSELLSQAGLNGTFRVYQAEEHNDQRDATTATYVAVVIVVLVSVLMFAGTVYDIFYIRLPGWRAEWAQDAILYTAGSLDEEVNSGTHGDYSDVTPVSEDDPLLGTGSRNHRSKSNPSGKLGRALLAFSIYTNGSKVLNTSQPPGAIGCIHGIRFLSMTWVILGHFIIFGMGETENFMTAISELIQRWTFDAVANAFVSVDTFFTLSGILTAYVTLGQMQKTGWKMNWGLFYFHRFWRLTPPYMLTIALFLGLHQYTGHGPLWPKVTPVDKEFCEDNWWTNLLYVNNLVHNTKVCFSHSWYLANDMQFYWVSPLMLIPLYVNKWLGFTVCGVFILTQWITTGILSTQHGWPASMLSVNSPGWITFFTDYYVAPWCRIGPFVVGLITGYLLVNSPKNKVNMTKSVAIGGWLVAAATALAVLYGLRGDISGKHPSSEGVIALYNAVARSAWGACVCWVIVACSAGWGGFINTFLSWSPFVVLGRLTYMAYLIHPNLIYIFFQNEQTLFYLNDVNMSVSFMGIIVSTYGIAFFLMLGLESPWIGLEKVFLPSRKKD